jgi:hypothetical protein
MAWDLQLTGIHMIIIFSAIMESQKLANGTHPGPIRAISHHHNLFLQGLVQRCSPVSMTKSPNLSRFMMFPSHSSVQGTFLVFVMRATLPAHFILLSFVGTL